MAPELYTSQHPPFAVTVDLVVFTIRSGALTTLLIKRAFSPYENCWALPGGFVGIDEDLPTAAARELEEETSINIATAHLEQLATYGNPDRDPRQRVVSVAYLAMLANLGETTAGSDASLASWVAVSGHHDSVFDDLGPLAFDHDVILTDGLERARAKIEYSTLATAFLPERFTLSQLREVYEIIWGAPLHAPNFNRKVLATPGFVEATNEFLPGGRGVGRPARLYTPGAAVEIRPPLQRKQLS